MNVENIIREYISKSLHMSLATATESQPWVCELHFVYDEGLNLYWRSLPARRHSIELTTNPLVSGNIVAQHSIDDLAHGVYFEGSAEIVNDLSEIKRIYPLFKNRLHRDETIIDESQTKDGHKFYKVSVKTWYAFGTFDGNSTEKYTLDWNA